MHVWGAVSLLGAVACNGPPSAISLQEWTPADHHSTDDDRLKAAPGAQPKSGPAQRGNPTDNVAELVDLTWRQQCATCHGRSGRGDGPTGPMVKAPDLTDDQWQTSVTDADIAALIKNGKNKMPKFDLPDPVVAGLVARIRSLRQR
jgi:cytochrome c oxidase cbb3-type subunit 3